MNESADQSYADEPEQPDEQTWQDTDSSDEALLEEALRDALDAHAAGLLAAPFGVDAVALARARRRALRSDVRRQLAERQPSKPTEDNP